MDSSWEIFRLRRVKTSLIAKSIPSALRTTLAPLAHADHDSEWMDVLIKKWVAQKPSAIKQVNRLLASAKLTFDTVIARAVMANIDDIERIDRCITIAEGRRDKSCAKSIAGVRHLLRHCVTKCRTLKMQNSKPLSQKSL